MCRVGGGRSWVLEAHWEDRVEARVPVCVQPRRLEDVGDVERRKPAGPNPTKLLARPRLLYDELWLAGRISFLLRKFDFIRFDSGLDNLRLDGDIIIFINPGCFIFAFSCCFKIFLGILSIRFGFQELFIELQWSSFYFSGSPNVRSSLDIFAVKI